MPRYTTPRYCTTSLGRLRSSHPLDLTRPLNVILYCALVSSFHSVRHQVPYFSQWESPQLVPLILGGAMSAADDPLWSLSGASTPAAYEFWSWRICGMACLRMALSYWRGVEPPTVTLAQECLDAGAYVRRPDRVDGLIYAPFCSYVRSRWSLEVGSCPELPTDQLASHLSAGRLIMLSVHARVRNPQTEPPRRGGHLVLAVGATTEHLFVHNPSGLPGDSQEFAAIPWPRLERFSARRGVVLGPGAGAGSFSPDRYHHDVAEKTR
ncbi:MAG: C39 family peptidase [Pseudonocardia sp.]